ncbi:MULTISPECIES: Eco57I restriction-modification methylase domain-containing protein [Bacillus subtilis group]|uniref:Eco57I restriction-modification methylase domain-containing protein n=1 Tax=Bacillus subtilis group TaxID=653685 RepID=UPI001BD0F3FE|nr:MULTISPECIES: Eco57I restriction-modification methylase domain-containing protein [Bacillus subtilis group]MED0868404.1 Eco57I restriction-modification methylase domain-containing protein [Bacillus spizizenii]MED1070993.1 Eco57I restriction-modification methylase domain-containing protein [Bacillus spizizenii]
MLIITKNDKIKKQDVSILRSATMTQILETVDKSRLTVNPLLKNKSELGQFFTPSSISIFMASLFSEDKLNNAKVLDAGAGIGSLTSAFLARLISENIGKADLHLLEIDEMLEPYLSETLALFKDYIEINSQIIIDDFIEWAAYSLLDEESLLAKDKQRFTHAILNPPYKKIKSNSKHRKLLRKAGIETVNLYSAFVALTVDLMSDGGEIVFIIPRSFCNGPYFRHFRQHLLNKTSIKHMHLFESRDKAFKDDEVLQENVIMKLEKGTVQEDVKISISTDDSFSDYKEYRYPFEKIVQPNDIEKFIHINTTNEETLIEKHPNVCYSLEELNIEVSTGPVVDFRVKENLREMPGEGTVPLFYPNHFVGTSLEYPKMMKKPNAIIRNEKVEKWLYPNGHYVVVKRFSSKEEKRRIVAGVLTPESVNDPVVGFENGLNVLHYNKSGISKEVAYGLYAYLNSTPVDKYFRIFNGHTQVNATDLRTMKFPSRDILISLGKWVIENIENVGQVEIDSKLEELLLSDRGNA